MWTAGKFAEREQCNRISQRCGPNFVGVSSELFSSFFTALSNRPSVRPSVCLSVCQTRDLWQNERNLCPFSYTTWTSIYPSFM